MEVILLCFPDTSLLSRFRKDHEQEDYIPRTVEEWVLNIPTMLDARHGRLALYLSIPNLSSRHTYSSLVDPDTEQNDWFGSEYKCYVVKLELKKVNFICNGA